MMTKPRLYMTLGLILLILGIIFPFLMVAKIIESTFFLIFFTSAASTVGLALGMIGLTQWSVTAIKKRQYEDEAKWTQTE